MSLGPPPGGQAPTGGGPARASIAAVRLERWRSWLERLADALERSELMALDGLFAVETSYRPGPFSAELHGRGAIRSYWEAWLAERASVSITAEALGVGTTYAVAHWRMEWAATEAAGSASDGILLAAFDPRGRCTSLREWSVRA
jgi:SnoaL-like domain